MRRAALSALAALAAVADPASAHSLLLTASPAAGAVLTVSPPRVVLAFNNRIEKRLSRIRLVDAEGDVTNLSVAVAAGAPETLHADVPALGAGPYRLEWTVLSADGHIVSGSYSFRLAP